VCACVCVRRVRTTFSPPWLQADTGTAAEQDSEHTKPLSGETQCRQNICIKCNLQLYLTFLSPFFLPLLVSFLTFLPFYVSLSPHSLFIFLSYFVSLCLDLFFIHYFYFYVVFPSFSPFLCLWFSSFRPTVKLQLLSSWDLWFWWQWKCVSWCYGSYGLWRLVGQWSPHFFLITHPHFTYLFINLFPYPHVTSRPPHFADHCWSHFALKMEAICFSEVLVTTYKNTWRLNL
jgi:hypothetical protein